MSKTWKTSDKLENVLMLPQGSLYADFGIRVKVAVYANEVLEAAQYLVSKEWDGVAATQAKVMVAAKELGGLESYAELSDS